MWACLSKEDHHTHFSSIGLHIRYNILIISFTKVICIQGKHCSGLTFVLYLMQPTSHPGRQYSQFDEYLCEMSHNGYPDGPSTMTITLHVLQVSGIPFFWGVLVTAFSWSDDCLSHSTPGWVAVSLFPFIFCLIGSSGARLTPAPPL